MNVKFWDRSPLSRPGNERGGSPRLLTRLLRDEEGSYLLYMTLTIPIFIGLAALATEGAMIFYNHRNVQGAADSAAYSAAIAYSLDNSADITTQAQAIVASYGFTVGTGNGQANVVVAPPDTTTYSPLTAINVTVTRPQLPIVSSIWVSNPFSVSGRAWAIINGAAGGGNGNCMLALAPTGTAIALQGNPTINAPNCGIFSNSNGSCSGRGSSFTPSINLGGNGSITGGAVGAAGCVSVTGSSNIGPPPDGYTGATPSCPTCADSPVINPYAGITLPTPATCIDGPGSGVTGNFSGNGVTATLNPGTYCNGISATTHASVTLNPGTYILDGTTSVLTVTAGATLTGVGVTLVFTDPGGTTYPKAQGTPTALNISSGANIDLEAPAADATLGIPGMLILGDSNIPTDTAFNLQANATATSCTSGSGNCVGGVIYVPTADFTWQGGPTLTGGCTQMIAYRLIMQGNATFNNSNCNLFGGGGGVKPIGNVVTLVK